MEEHFEFGSQGENGFHLVDDSNRLSQQTYARDSQKINVGEQVPEDIVVDEVGSPSSVKGALEYKRDKNLVMTDHMLQLSKEKENVECFFQQNSFQPVSILHNKEID